MDSPRFIYLVILLIFVGGYTFMQNRHRLGQMAQHAVIWVLIFGAAVVLFSFKDDLKRGLFPRDAFLSDSGEIILQRAKDSHFYVSIKVNGQDVDFVVDTGATEVVLSQNDAKSASIDLSKLSFNGTAFTANGEVRTARVKLKTLALADYVLTDFAVSVNGGELHESLLGMSYLSTFTSIEIVGEQMILHR